jgi:hypothetical protein
MRQETTRRSPASRTAADLVDTQDAPTMANSPSRAPGKTIALLTACTFAMGALSGCFNTYTVGPEQFARLQVPDEVPASLETLDGGKVLVDKETNIYVRSVGGRRYPITPFNFKMSSSQLVASDRDTLLPLQEVGSYEVDLFNETNTIILISAGVAAVAGLIVVTALTAGQKTFTDE